MSFTSKGTNEIIVAGLQDHMFVVDVNKGEVVKRVRFPHGLEPGCISSLTVDSR